MQQQSSQPRLLTLILLTALTTLTLNMFLPSLASIAQDFDADYGLVSLSLGGYLAATAVIQLVLGPLSDRIGRRPVVLASLGIFALASLGCALSGNVWAFLGFRMLQSAMIAGYAMSIAIVRDTAPERQAAGIIGYIGMSMAVAPMLGPVVGGALDTAFGWRANFWVYLVSGIVLFLLCLRDLGETRPPVQTRDERDSLRGLLREPRFWAYALCTATSRGTFYIFIAGAPLVATLTFGVTAAELGIYLGIITAGFLAGSFVAGRLAPSLEQTTMMLAGRLVAAAGPVAGLLVLWSGMASPLLYFGCAILVGMGNGITIPSSSAAALSVRPRRSGSAAGFEGALTVAGGAILTTVTAFLLPLGDSPTLLLLFILATALAGLGLVVWARRLEASEKVRDRG